MSKLNPMSEERKREIKNAVIKELKGLIFPTVVLGLIVAAIFFILHYQAREVEQPEIVVNAYTGDGNPITIENDSIKMVMDPLTTNFDLTVKSSGKVWHSSPVDAAEKGNNEEKNRLQSPLILTYSNETGLETKLDSYGYSAVNGIYDIEAGSDFITVHYSIGKVSKEYVFPPAIRADRFEELVSELSATDKENVKAFYKKYDKAALDKLKDAEREAKLEQYPLLAEETLYVLRNKDSMKETAKKTLQKQFAAAGYTYEEFVEDKELDTGETVEKNPVFNCDVTYRLDGDDLVVEVPFSSLESRIEYPIYKLNILPYFGAGGKEEDGFILVPEGGGSIINFNNGKLSQSTYYSNLYGWDMAIKRDALVHNTVANMNVYGISDGKDSFICIMEDGSSYATVEADISGKGSYYNYATATYLIKPRENYDLGSQANTTMYVYLENLPEDESIVKRYSFVDSSDYTKMAEDYRDYLVKNYSDYFKPNTDTSTPVAIEMVGAVDKVKQIVGIPVSKPLPLTTYKEAAELISDLKSNGMDNLYVKYTGWMNGGVKQKYLKKVKLISSLGSKKDLNKLSQTAKDLGVTLYLDGITNYEYNSNIFNGFFSYRDAAKFLSKQRAELYIYSDVTYAAREGLDPYYLLHGDTVIKMCNNLVKAADKYNANVSFHDVGKDLSSDFYKKDYTSREEALNMQVEVLENTYNNGMSIMINEGNAYAAPYADFITNMDLKGSEYTIIDETIPFYQIALHGYVNYSGDPINVCGNTDEAVLTAAKYGSGLSFSLMKESPFTLQKTLYTEYYASDYDSFADIMYEIYNRYNAELGHTFNQTIVGFENLTGDVSVTCYEDGTKVYVNYGFSDYSVDGVKVPARDYLVVK